MAFLSVNGVPNMPSRYASLAGGILGAMLARKEMEQAAAALSHLADLAQGGVLSMSADDPRPDPIASLWFIRAAHLYGKAGGEPVLVERLRNVSKRLVQEFISAKGVGEVTMDNGGMLVVGPGHPVTESLRLNALWYSALESTAEDLRAAKDPSGDHFERLAGRFRRTFAKAYWCEGHNQVCPPYLRTPESHGDLPEADQLLLAMLPASPIPRTKQRQAVMAVRNKAFAPVSGEIGVIVEHPQLGRVTSVIHQAWLALGILRSAESTGAVMAEVQAVLEPLRKLYQASGGKGVAAYYRNGKPVADPDMDALASAEIFGAIEEAGGG